MNKENFRMSYVSWVYSSLHLFTSQLIAILTDPLIAFLSFMPRLILSRNLKLLTLFGCWKIHEKAYLSIVKIKIIW